MPEPLIVQFTQAFQDDLDNKYNEATQTMVSEWLEVEKRLKDQILGLATELAAPPEQVKLDPVAEMVTKLQAAGYDTSRLSAILEQSGIFTWPDIPNPQAKEIKDWQLFQMERYVQLLAQVQAEINKFTGQTAGSTLEQLQNDAALAGAQNGAALINLSASSAGGSAVDLSFTRLNREAVQNIVAISGTGRPLGDLLEAAYPAAASGITRELIYGTARGQNPRQTARNIISNGLAQGLNHILLVSRDQQIRAMREGARQQYLKAGVRQYRRLAAKQTRTCLACLALDGSVWPTEILMPLHPQDRCSMLPVVPGFSPVQTETGEAWFKRQPAEVQRQMMGSGRYDAWKKGEFAFNQLATIKDNPTWGPNAQATPLRDLKKGRGGFTIPGQPRPPKPSPQAAGGPSPLPTLDHDLIQEIDPVALHALGPEWGAQADWKHNPMAALSSMKTGKY